MAVNEIKLKEVAQTPLAQILQQYVREGDLYRKLDDDRVECYSCGHRCVIRPGMPGICRVRFNEGGKLFVPWGYAGALQCDPIEKKPFFHAYPGAKAMSFGMLGCDFTCDYCQNWLTSQALRDPVSTQMADLTPFTPDEFVAMARRYGARVVTSTYNEPLITSEWAVDIFKVAKREGFVTSYVSNGNGTPEVLDYLRPWCDLYKIDLKSFRDRNYRQLGGKLETVLETIKGVYARGMWLEIVTLVVPGFNDTEEELRDVARFIVSVSPDIPWHVTAFHKDYKMTDPDNTTAAQLIRAADIGREEGLRYVYAGNLPGQVGTYENTYCYHCGELLIERYGYRILRNVLHGGHCPRCETRIAGRWD
ncbi:MAG: AmmeMemoRadiSam system radical SAM enzyme [Abditibacteriales bacterium]|nr:AmmeMemoRadiSam system radical SAM enzyme [Abditibacteriales bacterium]MDW8367381.1 AmmeMemoRadiSam system radical SAM enzyme [Abditibacteriales bacterium]